MPYADGPSSETAPSVYASTYKAALLPTDMLCRINVPFSNPRSGEDNRPVPFFSIFRLPCHSQNHPRTISAPRRFVGTLLLTLTLKHRNANREQPEQHLIICKTHLIHSLDSKCRVPYANTLHLQEHQNIGRYLQIFQYCSIYSLMSDKWFGWIGRKLV